MGTEGGKSGKAGKRREGRGQAPAPPPLAGAPRAAAAPPGSRDPAGATPGPPRDPPAPAPAPTPGAPGRALSPGGCSSAPRAAPSPEAGTRRPLPPTALPRFLPRAQRFRVAEAEPEGGARRRDGGAGAGQRGAGRAGREPRFPRGGSGPRRGSHRPFPPQRFRFCGDLDCPDWVLAEISVLAKIVKCPRPSPPLRPVAGLGCLVGR